MLGRGRASLMIQNIAKFSAHAHNPGGIPSRSLPFCIKDRYVFTVKTILFMGVGLAAPFLVVQLQYSKK